MQLTKPTNVPPYRGGREGPEGVVFSRAVFHPPASLVSHTVFHRPFFRSPPTLDDTCPRRFREWNTDHGECPSLLPLGDPRWWEVGGWSASCKIIIYIMQRIQPENPGFQHY